MLSKLIKATALSTFTTTLLSFSVLSLAPVPAFALGENGQDGRVSCQTVTNDSNSGGSGSSGATQSGGDFLVKGTPANNVAQQIFDLLTKKEGFSGAGASGALAVGRRESNLIPNVKNPSGGVAGIFQWSGWNGNTINGSRITSGGFINGHDDSQLTIENELKLVDYELNNGYKKVKQTVGTQTDPVEGAKAWSVGYEGVSLSDGQSAVGNITQWSQNAYIAFGGAGISANSALLGATDSAGSGTSADVKNSQGDCGGASNIDAGDVVGLAKQLISYFTYSQPFRKTFANNPDDLTSISKLNRNGQADCSSFVWLVLKLTGYNVPAGVGWYTKTMEDDAKGAHKFLKEIPANQAKAGDVVIVNAGDGKGSNGHTAILTGNWKAPDEHDIRSNTTPVIEEGGEGGGGGVAEGTIHYSFGELAKPKYGGYTITYAEPIKK